MVCRFVKGDEELECDGQEQVKDRRLGSFYASVPSHQFVKTDNSRRFYWRLCSKSAKQHRGEGEGEWTNQRPVLGLTRSDHMGALTG